MNEFDELFELVAPHSAEAEQAVIGSMLIDSRCINDVLSKARSCDFYLEVNRDVFDTISSMQATGQKIDPVTVLDKMKLNGTIRDNSQQYLLELMQVTPTAANVMRYVDILLSETMRRELLTAANDTVQKVRDGMNPQDVCVYMQDKAVMIAEEFTSNDIVSSLDACGEFYSYLDSISEHKKPYVPSGYDSLDYVLGGGFMNEGLYILAARPGIGKTTIALQIAEKVAKAGIPTLFVSLEMSKTQITAKRVSSDCGVNYTKILTGDLDRENYTKVAESCSKLSSYPLSINRKPSATVDEINYLAHKIKDLGFVVVDYLGLIRNSNGKSIYEKTTDTSNNLKRLAKSLGVPILCLAQLNRGVEGRQTNKPRVSDLRDSGAIEQDADGILLLHRDMENAPTNDTDPTELMCTVGKNRHGKIGDVPFTFFPATGRIFAVREFR